jgi:hypothetical protein
MQASAKAVSEAVTQAMTPPALTGWHRVLLEQALLAIGDFQGPLPEPMEFTGCVTLEGAWVHVDALPDRRSLRLSSPVSRPMSDRAQQRLALSANTELMLLTGACMAAQGDKLCLQCHWNSDGLDGIDLADQMVAFARLSASISQQHSGAAAA